MPSDFLVRRDDLRSSQIATCDAIEPQAGQALLRVEKFGLTANNITYAVFGEAMSYWDFFPAADGWGRVPVWGFAEVARSEAEGVEPGTRIYGYLPPSSELLVAPASIAPGGFIDGAPHRAELPSAYHRYLATAADPFYRSDTEALQMLLRPLFFTSFLIDDQLADERLVERGPIVIASASSKTAIGAAFLLAQRDGVEVIGLTSARNVEFVEGLEIYGDVLAYEQIEELERTPATFVDMAGDKDVRLAVHTHFREQLAHSMAVGVTHWEEFGAGQAALPGPHPVFFFAPDRVNRRAADWGPAGLQDRVADAWHPFCEWAGGWLEVLEGHGFDELQRTYLEVLEGRVSPRSAHVLTL